MTGILVSVGASLRSRRFASLVAATPGVRGSPAKRGMSATEPRWAPALIAPGTLRVDVALEVAVVARVGVDEAAHGPVLGRDLGLDAAPGPAVAGDDDLALHVDAVAGQGLVVAGHAVVDVHEGALHVAVDRVGVVDGKLLLGLARGRVLLEGGLGEAGRRSAWAPSSRGAASSGWGRGRRSARCAPRSPRTGTARARTTPRCPAVGRAHLVGARGQALHPGRAGSRPGAGRRSGPRGRAAATEDSGEKPRRGLSAVSGAPGQDGQGDEGECRGQDHGVGSAHAGSLLGKSADSTKARVALAGPAGYREPVCPSRPS